MKYTVEGFNQQKLIEYGLDCTDAVILRYIVDFWHSGKMQVHSHDGEADYFWMSYKTIIAELPILKIKKQALADRMKKFTKCGLMKFYLWKTDQGTFTHYKLMSEKYSALVSNYKHVCSELQAPVGSKLQTKDSSTTMNHSTKDHKDKRFRKPTTSEIQIYLDELKEKRFTGADFYDSNEAKGWVIGQNKTPMKDWKAAVRTWINKKNADMPKSQYKIL